MKSIESEVKSLITCAYICKGFSRQQINLIYRQLSPSEDFNTFFHRYLNLKQYEK